MTACTSLYVHRSNIRADGEPLVNGGTEFCSSTMDFSPSNSSEDLGDVDDFDDMVTDGPSPVQENYVPETFPFEKLEQVMAGLNRLPSWVVYPLQLSECLVGAVDIAREESLKQGDRCGALCCASLELGPEACS